MHYHSVIHWKGYPKSRFPRIRFMSKRDSLCSPLTSSSIRKSRHRRGYRTKGSHSQVHKQVSGWESPSLKEATEAVSLNTDPVLTVPPTQLMYTGDGAEEGSSRIPIAKDNLILRPPAPAPDTLPPKRAMMTTTQDQYPSDIAKKRTYDPRISPMRLINRKTPVNSPASRTPSQRKTLRRFARELQLHLKAVENLPNKTLMPSPSITTIHTVEGLKPYHKQLLSAGLAVTGAEQRKRPSSLAKKTVESPKKAGKSALRRFTQDPSHMDGSHKSSASSVTLSTDHTVLSWTPPHQQPDPNPGLQLIGSMVQHAPEDAFHSCTNSRRKTTFKRSSNVHESLRTGQASRSSPAPPRNTLPWLQQQRKAAPATSISMKSPKHVNSPAESVKSPVCANVATHGRSLSRNQRHASADRMVESTQNLCNDSFSIEVMTPVYAHKAVQTSLSARNTKPRARAVRSDSPGQPTEACSLCSPRKRPRSVEEILTTGISTMCSRCESQQHSIVTKVEESIATCPLCLSRLPSNVVDKNRSVIACSKCSTRRPSNFNKGQSKKECPWCLLFQPRPLEKRDRLCSVCLAMDQSSPNDEGKSSSVPINSGPSCIKGNDKNTTPMYDIPDHAVVPDPNKRTPPAHSVPTYSIKSIESTRKDYINAKMQTPLPPIPVETDRNLRKREPIQISCMPSVSSCSTIGLIRTRPKASNKMVFRGLQVATNAACDEDIDQYVFEVTGRRVRDFLADLSILEGIGTSTLAGVAKRAAKQRRDEVRVLDELRGMNLEGES